MLHYLHIIEQAKKFENFTNMGRWQIGENFLLVKFSGYTAYYCHTVCVTNNSELVQSK